jgi:histidine triad (HIT) family protein
MTDCIFCQIANGGVAADLLYEDDEVVAFRDRDPQAPVHILVIPKTHIATLLDVETGQIGILGRLQHVAIQLARQLQLERSGFRLVTNCLEDGGQAVFHLHLHLLGGRKMSWPPG